MTLDQYTPDLKNTIENFKKDLLAIRAGRASSAMVEGIMVECYNSKMRLQELASISIPEPRMIIIQPWDKGVVKDVERALEKADLGASPTVEGQLIRVIIPSLTEERRQEIVKTLKQEMEKTKIQLRRIRDEARNSIKEKEQTKEITEDDKFNLFKELDETIADYVKEVDELGEKKEKEVMTI